jgi:nucleoside-triphosphatase THEP1
MPQTNLFVLTGPVHSGKTSLLARIFKGLQDQGRSLNGLLSLACYEGDEFKGYTAYLLGTGETFPLIRTTGKPEWERIGRYYFLPEAMDKVEDHILAVATSRLTVIDEMGPLELSGRGFWPCFLKLQELGRPVFTVIRDELISSFLPRFEIRPRVFSLESPQVEKELTLALKAILDRAPNPPPSCDSNG